MILKASYVGYQTKLIELTDELINNQLVIDLIPLTSTLNEVVISTESSKFLQSSSEIKKIYAHLKYVCEQPKFTTR